jgi:hypothetical protein
MHLIAMARARKILAGAGRPDNLDPNQTLADLSLPDLTAPGEPPQAKEPTPMTKQIDTIRAESQLILGFKYNPDALKEPVPNGVLGCKNGHPATRERSHCPICGEPINTKVSWKPSAPLLKVAELVRIDPVRLYVDWVEVRGTSSYRRPVRGIHFHDPYEPRGAGVPEKTPVLGCLLTEARYDIYAGPDTQEEYASPHCPHPEDMAQDIAATTANLQQLAQLLGVTPTLRLYHTVETQVNYLHMTKGEELL